MSRTKDNIVYRLNQGKHTNRLGRQHSYSRSYLICGAGHLHRVWHWQCWNSIYYTMRQHPSLKEGRIARYYKKEELIAQRVHPPAFHNQRSAPTETSIPHTVMHRDWMDGTTNFLKGRVARTEWSEFSARNAKITRTKDNKYRLNADGRQNAY
jgi:hypothetical protein